LDILREMEFTGQRVTPQRQITIEEWRDQYIKNAKTENIDVETIRKYKTLFKKLLAFTQDKGIKFIAGVNFESVQQFRDTWELSPITKSKEQERMRSIFRFAMARKWILENPALLLGRIQVKKTQKEPFTTEEIEEIYKVARKTSPEVYTFILTMRFSGLRISDVAMLRVDSLHNRHLVLRTEKTGVPVKVLLPKVVVDALLALKRKTPEYFFWNGTAKLNSATDYWRNRKIKPVFKEAKIKNAHPHRFRHTFAVELLKQGTATLTVANLLGDIEKTVSDHYSAWVETRQKGLDEAVEKANGYHHLTPVEMENQN
jgi:site-specific recombinase XerD